MTKEELLATIQQAKEKQWTGLDLSLLGITELPPEIGQLTALQSLDLRGNQLNQLPPEIGQLTALQSLDLRGNQLNQLPPEITQLTALQSLYLFGNQLNRLPTEIESLKSLVVLDVRHNTAYLPEIIGKLRKQSDGIYIPQHSPNLPEEFLIQNSFEIYSYLTSDIRHC